MRIDELSEANLRQLHIMANVAAEKVQTSIERWIHKDVGLKVISVGVEDFNNIAVLMGGFDAVAAVSIMEVEGDLEGRTGFIFPQKDALSMVDLLRKRPVGTSTSMDEVSKSVLNETCNIVGCAFLNALVADLGLKMMPKSPAFCFDLIGSVLDFLLLDYAVVGDKALLFKTQFEEKDDRIGGYFFLLPHPDHVFKLLKALSENGS